MVDVVKVVVTNARGPAGEASGPLGSGSVSAENITNTLAQQLAIADKIGTFRSGKPFTATFDTSNPTEHGLRIDSIADNKQVDGFFGSAVIQAGGAGYGMHSITYVDASIGPDRAGGGGFAIDGPGNGSGGVGNRRGEGPGNGLQGARVGSGDGAGLEGRASSTGTCYAVRGLKQNPVGGTAGPGPSIFAINDSSNGEALYARSAAGNTTENTVVVDRLNGSLGSAVFARVSGSGARSGAIKAMASHVVPSAASTGTALVYAHDVQINGNVTGSADVRGINVANSAGSAANAFGTISVVDGNNATNYAVFGNAANGTTNWSGYFVGNVFIGGTLTNPSDKRLKTVHGEVDGAEALAAVRTGKVYRYDKFLDRKKERLAAANEIGPIAQELRKVSPDHVSSFKGHDKVEILGVNDRSELYQLKAAVAHLAGLVEDLTARDA